MSSKRVLAFGCGVEVALVQWKKKTVFLLGGLFGKTAALPTAASPSKGFEKVLTSPLLKSFHPSKRATSSHIQEHLTCLSPTTTVQPHCCKAAVRVMLRSMGNVQSRSPQSTHTHSKQCTLGTLTSQHVFIISVTLLHGLHPVTGICGPARHRRAVGVIPLSGAS